MIMVRAQGATEYLVLLAIVLIVALVSVALLGFFPGMATDSQMAQSKAYWQSASPIAIVESDAMNLDNPFRGSNFTTPYLLVRNTGPYKITITKVIAGNQSIGSVWSGGWSPNAPISAYFTLAPGEETYFGSNAYWPTLPSQPKFFNFPKTAYVSSANFNASSEYGYCASTPPYGYFIVKNFGFEYIEHVEGHSVIKRQTGPMLIIPCSTSRAA